MQPHSLAQIFPMMSADEFEGLKADINKNGLIDPITTLDGQILDGRNRLKACEELGIEPRFVEFTGNDPYSWVIAKNFHRRRLSKTQVAITMIQAVDCLKDEGLARKYAGLRPKTKRARTVKIVSDMFANTISATTLSRYIEVRSAAHADVWQALLDDKITVFRACKIAKLPLEQQPDALINGLPVTETEQKTETPHELIQEGSQDSLATVSDKLHILLASASKDEKKQVILKLLQTGDDCNIHIVEQIRAVALQIQSQEQRKAFIEALGALTSEFRDVILGQVPVVSYENLQKLRREFYRFHNVSFPEKGLGVTDRSEALRLAIAKGINEEMDLAAVIESVPHM